MGTLILLASCVLAVLGDLAVTWWAKHPNHPVTFLATGTAVSLAALVVWAYSMRVGIESSRAITLYAIFTTMAVSSLGIFMFNETMSPVNWVGMVLGLVAIVLLRF